MFAPLAYQSDGGLYGKQRRYFIDNVFKESEACYTTDVKVIKNVSMQAYFGKDLTIAEEDYVKFCKTSINRFIDLTNLAPCSPEDEQFKLL